jgi:hypothetical protein
MYAERDRMPLCKLNAEIRASDTRRPGDLIPFFCECLRNDCFLPVWLTAAEYDDRTAARRAVTAGAHDTSTLAEDLATLASRRSRKARGSAARNAGRAVA